MSVYLHDIPLDQAQERFLQALISANLGGMLGVEEIPLNEDALGRVLAEPVWARLSSPHYHASAMDGFAMRAAITEGASPSTPVTIECCSQGAQTAYVDTGDPLPGWADCVIPIENTEAIDAEGKPAADPRRPYAVRIRTAVTPWSHVRPLGEDIVATQLVLPAGQTLRPVDLGAIAACGHDRVRVTRRPRVAILPTGSELTPIGKPVGAGEIIEYNSLVLAAQVNGWGGISTRFPITPDNFSAIQQQVQIATREHDLILLNAGSSAGAEDFSAQIVGSLGELLVHGVAVRPGHPVILGMVHLADEQKIPIIGVPGYPVSAALTAEIFVEPLLARWLGRRPNQPTTLEATLTRKITSPAGDDDFVRVAVGRVGQNILAAPLTRGAGVITSLVKADGLALLPRGVQGLPAGAPVSIRLYRSMADIERTIFAIGSHDITLDLIAQYLSQRGISLTSANVGSLGGLVALRRGEAHLAGSHLMDPQSGEYNLSYIQQYLPGTPVRVIALVGRAQGLMVQRGNPLHILGLEDLVRSEVHFVNRQRGAGTRVLLDYHLERLGIASEAIYGYNQEEYTHLAVAASIASGRSDCGLGIAAAAQALDLDFVSLFSERYDLVIPQAYASSPLLEPLFDILADGDFRAAVAKLPGYDVEPMGTLIAEMG
jgi:putative molybdopterin biosynthesis protein